MTTSPYLGQQPPAPVWQKLAQAASQDSSLDQGEWITQAACRQGDPDALFVKGAQQRTAAEFCRRCRVMRPCLAISLDNREEFGVWGGLTERQRRALLRKNTHIDNWAEYLAAGGELADS